jgi:hypothetical protein
MIENTSNRDALVHYAGMAYGGQDRYVPEMEAAGQAQLARSSQLPKQAPWPQLEALGFVRGADVQGAPEDELFVEATLPPGWRMQPCGDPRESMVVDERGVARVGIFFKAAFYDRRATAHIVNVGGSLANKSIYGGAEVALPDCWAVLTPDERARYSTALDLSLTAEIRRRQTFRGEALGNSDSRVARIHALLALTQAQSGTGPETGAR